MVTSHVFCKFKSNHKLIIAVASQVTIHKIMTWLELESSLQLYWLKLLYWRPKVRPDYPVPPKSVQTIKTCFAFWHLTARDVVADLEKQNISDPSSFPWISQMRYYFEEQSVMVRMITSTVPYGYEYLGNTSRLVITPLTDRCYRYDCKLIIILGYHHFVRQC